MKALFVIGVLALVLLISVKDVRACNPAVPTICQAYTRAESVFMGKLTKLAVPPGNGVLVVDATFEVKRVFKGEPSKVEVIRFDGGDCGPRIKEVGIDYFVYKDEPRNSHWSIANHTAPLSTSKSSLEYAESLSSSNPVYAISGRLITMNDEDLKAARMTISSGGRETKISLNKYGVYKFKTSVDAEYEVKISLPFTASFRTKVLKEEFESEGFEHKFTLKFKPNECDFREIEITRGQ